jgi:hypothetical protein
MSSHAQTALKPLAMFLIDRALTQLIGKPGEIFLELFSCRSPVGLLSTGELTDFSFHLPESELCFVNELI